MYHTSDSWSNLYYIAYIRTFYTRYLITYSKTIFLRDKRLQKFLDPCCLLLRRILEGLLKYFIKIMISVVIITELLVEYTSAIAKLTAGILPRRPGDGNVVRIGGFSLPFPTRSSPIPDFSSHLVDFWSATAFSDLFFWISILLHVRIVYEIVTAETFSPSVSLSLDLLFFSLDFESLRAFVTFYRKYNRGYGYNF